jgi:predicted peptidase
MLRELVLSIREQHADVAEDRLFVVGISRGGWGALEFAAAHGQALGIAGMVVCCPERIESLNAALAVTPVYLFHGDGDKVVVLDETRSQAYESLAGQANFRWVRVRPDRTIGEKQHNCWTYLFGHPGIYHWFTSLANDPNYSNQKDTWPDFADLSVPTPTADEA